MSIAEMIRARLNNGQTISDKDIGKLLAEWDALQTRNERFQKIALANLNEIFSLRRITGLNPDYINAPEDVVREAGGGEE